MAKVDRKTIDKALNEANELEYELSSDDCFRELDEYESYVDEYKPQYYTGHLDYGYDWRNDCFYGDY